MTDQPGSRRISSGLIAVVTATVLAVGGSVAWITSKLHTSPPINNSPTVIQPKPPVTANKEQTTNIYWLKPTDKGVDLVPKPIKVATAQPNQVLEAAFQSLFTSI